MLPPLCPVVLGVPPSPAGTAPGTSPALVPGSSGAVPCRSPSAAHPTGTRRGRATAAPGLRLLGLVHARHSRAGRGLRLCLLQSPGSWLRMAVRPHVTSSSPSCTNLASSVFLVCHTAAPSQLSGPWGCARVPMSAGTGGPSLHGWPAALLLRCIQRCPRAGAGWVTAGGVPLVSHPQGTRSAPRGAPVPVHHLLHQP